MEENIPNEEVVPDPPMKNGKLDSAKAEAKKMWELYASDPRQHTYNLLLLGDAGTGKTRILETCRKPIHVDCFDKGGSKTIREMVEKKDCIADTRYENEDPLKPSVFALWKREFEVRLMRGYFENIGTYCLDSSSAWCDAMMNWLLDGNQLDANRKKGESRVGTPPVWQTHYYPQKILLTTYIEKMLSLPCDFILTGHLKPEYEETIDQDGNISKVLSRYEYKVVGDASVMIPTKFDEMYIMLKEETGGRINYKMLTSKAKLLNAKTRLGRDKFAQYEPPDIKALLRKAGWDPKDKPRLV